MTLLETVYRDLKHNDLVKNAEHFCTIFLKKSRSWYAVQIHKKRDFSAPAAIHCLRNLRLTQARAAELSAAQHAILRVTEGKVLQFLREKYAVEEIA